MTEQKAKNPQENLQELEDEKPDYQEKITFLISTVAQGFILAWCLVVLSLGYIKLPNKFPRITYADAMERYGSDKPDVRYEMELIDVKVFTDESDFKAFSDAESVKALLVKTGAKYSRKIIDNLTDKATFCNPTT